MLAYINTTKRSLSIGSNQMMKNNTIYVTLIMCVKGFGFGRKNTYLGRLTNIQPSCKYQSGLREVALWRI